MKKTDHDYLLELLQELADIAAFTINGKDEFMSDVKTQKAVIRSYEVTGEICKRLPVDLRAANPQIDWRRLIGFRDFLAHNYEFIALNFVWDAVADVDSLRKAVETLLASLPPQDEDEEKE